MDLATNLVGVREIAVKAGVGSSAVCNWAIRYEDFPQPVVVLSFGPVYWWPTIERWLKATGRLAEITFEI